MRVVTASIYALSISAPMRVISAHLSPGSNFTIEGSVILFTSATMSLSTGDIICAPSLQNTLYPLYSFGLWDAVIITPAVAFFVLTAKLKSGIGRRRS